MTTYLSEYEQGKILWIKFPFTNLKETKKRPAIVVSKTNFNFSEDLILVPCTTSNKNSPFDIILNDLDIQEGKLIKKTYVKCDKVFTLNKNLIFGCAGKINKDLSLKINKKIKDLIEVE